MMQAPENYRCHWLQEAKDVVSYSEPLTADEKVDVGIIGGGYVGLWSAIQIKTLDPACDVAVLEMDICGGGASGRNGGFVLSWWPKISTLTTLLGEIDAVQVAKTSEQAQSEIQNFCETHEINCHFRKSKWLWTATSKSQREAWESVVRACEKRGKRIFSPVEPEMLQTRLGSKAHLEGIESDAALVQPAILVRGLKKVAVSLGVKIFEKTKVIHFTRRSPIRVKTPFAHLTCEKLIIANNAWAAGILEFSRSIVAITSDMIITEPAKDAIDKMGWKGGECVTDSQTMVDYYSVTQDHRIAFGKGGWGIAMGGNLRADFDRNATRAKSVEADFRRYFPALNTLKIEDYWSGPVDRTPTSLPLLGTLPKNPNIHYGVGWSGNGIGPSLIGGKVLANLALNKQNEWSSFPLIGKSQGSFPPEPIRFIGAHLVRSAVATKERAEMDDRPPPFWAKQFARFAPKGLEDK